MKRITTFIILYIFSLAYLNANPDELLQKVKDKYPDEIAVFLEYNREVVIDIKNDSVKVTSYQYYDMLHLNEQSNLYSNDKIFSSHFLKVTDIDAKTLIPLKRKYKELPVTNFTENSEISEGIFYDDSKSISFVYPGVTPGCRTVLSYTTEFLDPRFLNSFHFNSFIPIVNSRLTLKVNKNVAINKKLFNTDSLDIVFNESKNANFNIYTWEVKNVPDIESESDAPAISYYSPHIIYYINSYSAEGKNHKVLTDAGDLYLLYSSYLNEINEDFDNDVKIVVDSITANCSNEIDKVKSIFYWVQDNIKYVAFENGMRGLIPHDGSLVCQKRYGDCKDMASIIHYMLKLAGIESYFTWIGSRDLPYKYSELPTPNVDNHMITTYNYQDKYYFLDATSKYTPFGFPSSMIQGKEALVAVDKDNFKILEVPVIPKSKNQMIDSSVFRIEKDNIKGKGKLILEGYHKIFNTYVIEAIDKETEEEFITGLVNKGNNKFFVDHYEIINLKERDKPLMIEYSYTLQDYYKNIDGEIFLNVNLDKSYFNDKIKIDQRRLPIEHEYLHENKHITTFTIPEGYELDYLPGDYEYNNEYFGFNIHYEIKNNKIIQYKSININSLLIDKSKFDQWNKMISQLNDAYREVLILKKSV